MSPQLVDRNADLKRLRDDGYELRIVGSYLVVDHVPYVNSNKEIKYGVLVSELTLSGDATQPPSTHVAYFVGTFPCKADGSPISQIQHVSGSQLLAPGLLIDHSFSNKPVSRGYTDFHDKMTTYVKVISGFAQEIDPSVTACTFSPIQTTEGESVFCYLDTASSRAGIGVATARLQLRKIAIVGLGGTGSYVLDLVAKCPVGEIHLFDGDYFLSHNAFRSPGAASIDELRLKPKKAAYWAKKYASIHRHVIPHDHFVDESTLQQLDDMEFAFLCLDEDVSKRHIVGRLLALRKPFIDVGMGLNMREGDQALSGSTRITTSTAEKSDHIYASIPLTNASDGEDLYSKNIQIADLNALNAALAVLRWKKHYGFYASIEGQQEYTSVFGIVDNSIVNVDLA